jgi:glycerophosphoryl diester phosphodiesterase
MTPSRIPALVAHRGYPARFPENTLIGIQAAAAAGARWIEFDVQLSRDHLPFLCHDASLKRTAGLDRSILELSTEELAGVDVGEAGRLGARFPNTRLTPLDELVRWLRTQPQLNAFVEIKRQSLRHFGRDLVVNRVMQVLEPALTQCVVISFDEPCLPMARTLGAQAVGWAIEDAGTGSVATARNLKPEYLFAGDRLFPAARAALQGPWQWAVYEVQDPAYASQLTADGAALVETDAIAEMLAALGQAPA